MAIYEAAYLPDGACRGRLRGDGCPARSRRTTETVEEQSRSRGKSVVEYSGEAAEMVWTGASAGRGGE